MVKLGTCVSATGSVALGVKLKAEGTDKTVPAKYKDTVVNLNDSSLDINGFKSPAKDCSTRPVIDFTRLI